MLSSPHPPCRLGRSRNSLRAREQVVEPCSSGLEPETSPRRTPLFKILSLDHCPWSTAELLGGLPTTTWAGSQASDMPTTTWAWHPCFDPSGSSSPLSRDPAPGPGRLGV